MRTAGRLLSLVLLAIVVYLALSAVQVWLASRKDETAQADAIVVLGAAQYDGRPSPALKARLDHAATLYGDGRAPLVWVTGGKQPGDRFSEASASDLYLQDQGVARDDLRLEVHGANTYEALAAAARELRRNDHRDVLLVSDPWHSYRLAAIAADLGLRPRVSPARATDLSAGSVRRFARETAAVALGRIVGFGRLTRLTDRVAPAVER